MNNFITIKETCLSNKTKELLMAAGFIGIEGLALYGYRNNGFVGIKGIGPKKAQEIEELLTQEGWKCRPDSYDRLYFEVFGKPEDEEEIMGFYYRSPETDELFEDALETLTDREQMVLRHYYGIGRERLNFSDIAKRLNVSRERVKQIFAKALRKLRHPSRSRRFRNIRYSWEGLSNLCNEYYQEIQKLRAENQWLQRTIKEHGISINENLCGAISEFDFSFRTYKCLTRAGITMVEELADMEYEDLIKIRNLGRKGLDEIVEKLKERGIEIIVP